MADNKLSIGNRVIGVFNAKKDTEIKIKGELRELYPLIVKNDTDGLLYPCKTVERIEGETFIFEADIPNNEQLAEDIEQQALAEAQKRFGKNKSGDDIKDYHCKLTVNVVMK